MKIDRKLTIDPQVTHIRNKVDFLHYKLYPLLRNVSLDFRVDLWTLLVRPLFEMLTGQYLVECKTNQEKAGVLLRKTFKKFSLLKKNVDNKTISALMEYDFASRVLHVNAVAKRKWEAQQHHVTLREFEEEHSLVAVQGKQVVKMKVPFPKEVQEYINLKTSICPDCSEPCSAQHMLSVHKVYMPTNEALLETCHRIASESKVTKRNRTNTMHGITMYIKPFINCSMIHLRP